jgi:hypothetical protein
MRKPNKLAYIAFFSQTLLFFPSRNLCQDILSLLTSHFRKFDKFEDLGSLDLCYLILLYVEILFSVFESYFYF